MAKKKSRKGRRSRQRREVAQKPLPARQPEQAPPTVEGAARTPRSLQRSAADFVGQYAYVYFDLRKMFTVAAIMFILLIVANFVLTRMITL